MGNGGNRARHLANKAAARYGGGAAAGAHAADEIKRPYQGMARKALESKIATGRNLIAHWASIGRNDSVTEGVIRETAKMEAELKVRDARASARTRKDIGNGEPTYSAAQQRRIDAIQRDIHDAEQRLAQHEQAAREHGDRSAAWRAEQTRILIGMKRDDLARIQPKAGGAGKVNSERTAAAKKGAQTRANNRAGILPQPFAGFTPIARVPNRTFDLGAPPDARVLRATFGDQQLRGVLSAFTLPKLRDTAQTVGAKPGRSKADTVQRIYDAVTQEPYAATIASVGGQRL